MSKAYLKAPRVEPTSLEDAIAKHPLVSGKDFYTLPTELLEEVVDRTRAPFDAALLELERQLSARCGDHSNMVGYRDSQPIHYTWLARPLGPADAAFEMGMSWTPAQHIALKKAERRADWIWELNQAYCGWLVMNPTFLQEQQSNWLRPTKSFLDRWGLLGMAGPCLPIPAGPQLPVASRSLIPEGKGQLLFIPNHFPLWNSTELAALLEGLVSSDALSPHLDGWRKLVSRSSRAKKQLARYRRLFVLQHYWRVLFSRHAAALRRRRQAVREAFTAVLRPDKDLDNPDATDYQQAIHRDLIKISKVRGPNWDNH